jgi:hypothetical protein
MRAATMHEQIPGFGGATAIVVAVTAFWLALAGACWKAFFEPQVKQLRADHEAEKKSCARQIAELEIKHVTECDRLSNRVTALETMLLAYGPMSLRAHMQTVRSAEQISGAADHEGDDHKGLHAHRLPPRKDEK